MKNTKHANVVRVIFSINIQYESMFSLCGSHIQLYSCELNSVNSAASDTVRLLMSSIVVCPTCAPPLWPPLPTRTYSTQCAFNYNYNTHTHCVQHSRIGCLLQRTLRMLVHSESCWLDYTFYCVERTRVACIQLLVYECYTIGVVGTQCECRHSK